MTDQPSLVALARAVSELLEERFHELETHVGTLLSRQSVLELASRTLERKLDRLEELARVAGARGRATSPEPEADR